MGMGAPGCTRVHPGAPTQCLTFAPEPKKNWLDFFPLGVLAKLHPNSGAPGCTRVQKSNTAHLHPNQNKLRDIFFLGALAKLHPNSDAPG